MCGIYGSINNPIPVFSLLKKSLNHRGPDGCDYYNYKNIYLFHSRLAIQDLSENARQPFHYKHISIIYNGEIYNHLELRKICNGFDFTTSSDTELLLALYEKYNTRMFEFLDGMYAFCILDKKKNQILLARDRAGKKPLYLYQKGNKLVFSSELNTIKASVKDIEIDEQAIQAYIRCGFFYKGLTAYKNINEVKPGHYYIIDITTLNIQIKNYFDILGYYKAPKVIDINDAISQVDNALHKSVKSRLLSSDLEVGAFLSGGIDSSLIVAVASHYKKNIKTFTVKFDGAYDESRLAKLTAKKYNTDHHEIAVDINLKEDIEKILLNYGQPFMDSSAIPSYYLSKEAKKDVTVILNGDGADEIFGGYRRYVPAATDIVSFAKNFKFLLSIMPKPHNKKSIYSFIYRLIAMSNKKGLDYYLSSTTDIFEDVYKFDSNAIIDEMNSYIDSLQEKEISKLNQMLICDFNMLLSSVLLVKMDIATMSHSLEGRSPFLSKYMLALAPTLKDKFKIKGNKTKYILRELANKYLPKDIIAQPKRGFEVPLVSWVNKDLKENIINALDNSYSSNFINKKFIGSLLENKVNVSAEKRAKMLWSIYCLEVWKNNESNKIMHIA